MLEGETIITWKKAQPEGMHVGHHQVLEGLFFKLWSKTKEQNKEFIAPLMGMAKDFNHTGPPSRSTHHVIVQVGENPAQSVRKH